MFDDVFSITGSTNFKIIGYWSVRSYLGLIPAISDFPDFKPDISPIKTYWIFIGFEAGVAFNYYRDQFHGLVI